MFKSPEPGKFNPKVTSTVNLNLNFANSDNKDKIVFGTNKSPTVNGPTTRRSAEKSNDGDKPLFTVGKTEKGSTLPKRQSKENVRKLAAMKGKSKGLIQLQSFTKYNWHFFCRN